MHILINASTLKAGGGLQVADSFLSQIGNFPEHVFLVLLSPQLAYLQRTLSDYPNVSTRVYDTKATLLAIVSGKSVFLDNLVKEYTIEVAFTIFGPPLWRPRIPHVVGFARPQLMYPDSPFFKQMSWSKRLKSFVWERIKLHNFKICSDEFIVETRDIEKRLSQFLPKVRIHTVTNNANQIFLFPRQWDKSIALAPFCGFTLLTISANHSHKNLSIIPKVIERLIDIDPGFSFRFVITVTEEELPISAEYKPYIVFLGKTSVHQCPYLYEQADAMFLPTLLECFSASYPEAMYMKCPIITSDLPFAHSLCGEGAFYFDPLDSKDIAEKILDLAQDRSIRESLVAKGMEQLKFFDTFDVRAKKYIKVIEESKINITNETNHTRP